MTRLSRDQMAEAVAVMDVDRLSRGAAMSVHAPLRDGGDAIGGAHIRWQDGTVIEAWSRNALGHKRLWSMIRRWRWEHGFIDDDEFYAEGEAES